MEELLACIAELHARSAELKQIVIGLPGVEGTELRDCVYQLEAAIYVMERNAADAFKAKRSQDRPGMGPRNRLRRRVGELRAARPHEAADDGSEALS